MAVVKPFDKMTLENLTPHMYLYYHNTNEEFINKKMCVCVYNVHKPRRRMSQARDDTEGIMNNLILPSTGLLTFLLLPGFIGGWQWCVSASSSP